MKHVLVIRLSAFGDVALMAPVVQSVAAANADVQFTVAAPPMLQPLFEGLPNVRFLGVKKKQSSRDIYRQLRSVGADSVADLHQINRVGWALLLLRLDALLHLHPLKVRRIHKGRLSRWLFLAHLRRRPRRSQIQRYADVFRRLGLSPKTSAGESAHWLQNPLREDPNPLREDPSVGIAPFAQHRGKIWPIENTARLALMLAEEGYRVLLFGSPDEAPQLETIADRHPLIQSLAGKQTFAEELKIMQSLTVMVSMDSSNMHFASLMGVPVVSIWGATHPDFGFYGFRQDRSNALCADLPCQPCSAYGNLHCRYGDYRCLLAITPKAVFDKIKRLTR